MTTTPGTDRDLLFTGLVSDGWAAAAGKEQARFEAFCKRLTLPSDHPISLTLYLTWMREAEGASSKRIDFAVKYLDTMARIRGRAPWRRNPEIARFLRGLYRKQRIGPHQEAADPLYRELVEVLVAVIMTLNQEQQRDRAAVLLRHHTNMDIDALLRLRWRDIHLTRQTVRIQAPRPAEHEWEIPVLGGLACLGNALGHLRNPGTRPSTSVLNVGLAARVRIEAALTAAEPFGNDLDAQVRAATHSNLQVRDRAILLIAYGAALTRSEIISLRQEHITVTPLVCWSTYQAARRQPSCAPT